MASTVSATDRTPYADDPNFTPYADDPNFTPYTDFPLDNDQENSEGFVDQVSASNTEGQEASSTEPDACIRDAEGAPTAEGQVDAENRTPWFSFSYPYKGILNGVFTALSFGVLVACALYLLFALLSNTLSHTNYAEDNLLYYFLVQYLKFDTYRGPIWIIAGILVWKRPRQYGIGGWNVGVLFAMSWASIALCPFHLLLGFMNSDSRQKYSSKLSRECTALSFHQCQYRVGAAQSALFTEAIYMRQFLTCLVEMRTVVSRTFNNTEFLEIRNDQILCSQGFEGNADLYGLGNRVSLYLQWLTAIFVNNALPQSRHMFRAVYMAYALALVVTTFVFTFSASCTFEIEVEILYWAYWGGFICVFASSPSYTRLRRQIKWIGVNWSSGINWILHVTMFYHGAFWLLVGYGNVFARMPCGTFHTFLAPFLDPSMIFWLLSDIARLLLTTLIDVLLFIPPIVTLLMASEIKRSIRGSPDYRLVAGFFSRPAVTRSHVTTMDPAPEYSQHWISRKAKSMSGFIDERYREFRQVLGLPSHARGGIRLVTPLDIQDRRKYRIRCALSGLASFVLSISIIEATLWRNKVVGVYSLSTTGQYWALTVGTASFVAMLWQSFKREAFRRVDLLRRHRLRQNDEDIELESLPHTFSGAVRYALGQPDLPFLTHDGAFESLSGVTGDGNQSDGPNEGAISEQPAEAPVRDAYPMSGALRSNDSGWQVV